MVRRESDYAFRILVHMILRDEDGPVTAADIARGEDIPRSFSQKVLRRLSESGILKARRGRGGGFSLARSPRDISMRDVVTAAQGGVRLGPCGTGRHACARRAACPVAEHWGRLQECLDDALGQTTLADIVARPTRRAGV